MIVSWNWLKQYVLLDMPAAELERRLMLAGLNHESTSEVDGDLAIDLEVTSNRPDCLGHLGIAREVAVLWRRELKRPAAAPPEKGPPVERFVRVRIDCPDLCARYTARVVRGVQIGPSPDWLVRRLHTVGVASVNNVVDISNYVLMECGQPLHTFDLAKLKGGEIVVRRPRPGERIEAIDHRLYDLADDMCVIADAAEAVAIGGVMGGARTEISAATKDILVEAAEFNSLSIRNTARRLGLHSDSSYRFERKIDPEGVDWASRRCCELLLELCGGELAAGVIDVGQPPPARPPVVLRYGQLRRVLGIDVPVERVREILLALGCVESPPPSSVIVPPREALAVTPPSWRRDLTREIDLIEEVARIHGYDAIPEDVGVPMFPSSRTRDDEVLDRVRQTIAACGFDEAMTLSVVEEAAAAAMRPWTDAQPLMAQMPVLRRADRLRGTLVPSLLQARQTNESLSNPVIELFEIARIYLPRTDGLPEEPRMLALTSGRSFLEVKGVLEALVAALRVPGQLEAAAVSLDVLDRAAACRLLLAGEAIGYVGRLTPAALQQFGLRGETVVAELKLEPLIAAAEAVPQYRPLPAFPPVSRDVNLVVDERVTWASVAATVAKESGPLLESLDYRDTYRDPQRLGPDKKSLLFSMLLRSSEGTLSSAQADEVRQRVVDACAARHGAALRA